MIVSMVSRMDGNMASAVASGGGGGAVVETFGLELEDDSGFVALEDDSGIVEKDEAP